MGEMPCGANAADIGTIPHARIMESAEGGVHRPLRPIRLPIGISKSLAGFFSHRIGMGVTCRNHAAAAMPIYRVRCDGRHVRKSCSKAAMTPMPSVVNSVIERRAEKTSGVSMLNWPERMR